MDMHDKLDYIIRQLSELHTEFRQNHDLESDRWERIWPTLKSVIKWSTRDRITHRAWKCWPGDDPQSGDKCKMTAVKRSYSSWTKEIAFLFQFSPIPEILIY